ncbi:spermatogenesis-associated protein 33 [Pteropus alecto]|uniref:spermatogenesis-associated protein 33 n=1 Tax=Pteropus alecto TaxID=9402 RepID=UPI0007686E86|nr:spermatogenesis-associated protein 33 [Pteropus alecto]
MGLCRSKPRPGKGEEQKKGCTCPVPKPKQRSMDRHPQESERPPDTKPAEGFSWRRGAAQQRRPSFEVEEKPDVKVKSSKKVVIPQITITTASNETLIGDTIGSEEQTTIREVAEWGAYSRHRNPSTADAYNLQTKE